CLTFPLIYTDERGYFITDLGNLRVYGNNYPCEDRWSKGDAVAVIANGLFTNLADGSNIIIDSESGATLSAQRLILTERKYEPLYSELSISKLTITSIEHQINWDAKKAVFNAEIYNPNNVPVQGLSLKVVVTEHDDRNNIIDIVEQNVEINALETKQFQLMLDIKDMKYGTYMYSSVLYTDKMTHSQVLDQVIELKPYLAFLTMQNIIILLMVIVIIGLVAVLARKSGKK
ncbi:hypothetical protein ACFL96_12095, partial [Thermoproteota archaeon]